MQIESKRQNNRQNLEIRPQKFVALEKGKANSRCLFESTNTKIICTMYGPSHSKIRTNDLECQLKIDLNFQNNPNFIVLSQENQTNQDREKQSKFDTIKTNLRFKLQEIIKSVVLLEEYQKQSITIVFDILEMENQEFTPTLFTSLANLLNFTLNLCGLQIQDQFSGSLSVVDKQNNVLVDPTAQEYQEAQNILELVILAGSSKIINFQIQGEVENKSIYEKLFSVGISTANSISQIMTQTIISNLDN